MIKNQEPNLHIPRSCHLMGKKRRKTTEVLVLKPHALWPEAVNGKSRADGEKLALFRRLRGSNCHLTVRRLFRETGKSTKELFLVQAPELSKGSGKSRRQRHAEPWAGPRSFWMLF